MLYSYSRLCTLKHVLGLSAVASTRASLKTCNWRHSLAKKQHVPSAWAFFGPAPAWVHLRISHEALPTSTTGLPRLGMAFQAGNSRTFGCFIQLEQSDNLEGSRLVGSELPSSWFPSSGSPHASSPGRSACASRFGAKCNKRLDGVNQRRPVRPSLRMSQASVWSKLCIKPCWATWSFSAAKSPNFLQIVVKNGGKANFQTAMGAIWHTFWFNEGYPQRQQPSTGPCWSPHGHLSHHFHPQLSAPPVSLDLGPPHSHTKHHKTT